MTDAEHLDAEQQIDAQLESDNAAVLEVYRSRMSELLAGIYDAYASVRPEEAANLEGLLNAPAQIDAILDELASAGASSEAQAKARDALQSLADSLVPDEDFYFMDFGPMTLYGERLKEAVEEQTTQAMEDSERREQPADHAAERHRRIGRHRAAGAGPERLGNRGDHLHGRRGRRGRGGLQQRSERRRKHRPEQRRGHGRQRRGGRGNGPEQLCPEGPGRGPGLRQRHPREDPHGARGGGGAGPGGRFGAGTGAGQPQPREAAHGPRAQRRRRLRAGHPRPNPRGAKRRGRSGAG